MLRNTYVRNLSEIKIIIIEIVIIRRISASLTTEIYLSIIIINMCYACVPF